MGPTLPARQKWLEHALQALAFWIGHRHSLFNAYPLTEGALVAEACTMESVGSASVSSALRRTLTWCTECA